MYVLEIAQMCNSKEDAMSEFLINPKFEKNFVERRTLMKVGSIYFIYFTL